jgi:hypothetical protein
MPDDERRGGIGGASGDAGVEYRRAVAAYAVVHGLTNVPLQGFGVAAPFAQVSAVCLETDDPVDDIRIEFVSGAISYVQAKRALRKGKPLNAAVEQWVRAARQGPEPARDHLVIVTGSVSGPIRVLQGALRRLKTDRPAALTDREAAELQHLRGLLGSLEEGDQEKVFKCASIHVLEAEEPEDAGAREAAVLLAQFVEPADVARSWRALVRVAGATARLRGGFDMRGWLGQLRDEGVTIRTSGGTPAARLESEEQAVIRYIAAVERKAARIDLRPLGARIPPLPIDVIDAGVEVYDGDRRGKSPLLWSFLRRRRAILTGLPGAGKSTALARLAALAPRVDDWLGLRVSLRDVDAMSHTRPFRDRLLDAALHDVPPADRSLLLDDLSRRLQGGGIVLLLDGLDETYQRRAAVVAEIDSFLGLCSEDVSVLLSTRDVAYGHAATLGWPELRLAPPEDINKLVAAVLVACRDAASARGEPIGDGWVRSREAWVRAALNANLTLRETPLIPTLLVLLAGERDIERLPTARANVMRAVVDSLLVRRDADPDRLRIGELVGDAAVAAASDTFAAEARALVDGGGQQLLQVLRTAIATELATNWGLAPGSAAVAADAAIRFWDEHGIFVISGAQELVAPRLPLFSEIGDAMAAVRNDADLATWVAARASQGAVEPLVLAAGLSPIAAEELAAAAIRSSEHALLQGAVRAYLDGATLRRETLAKLGQALVVDVAAGGREGWASLGALFRLPPDATSPEAIEAAFVNYPEEHRVIGRASLALHFRTPEDLRSQPTVLLAALATSRLKRLPHRGRDARPDRRALAVDDLYGSTIEHSAEVLVGSVDEAVDLVVSRLGTVSMGTNRRLHQVLNAAGMGDRAQAATSEAFRKTAHLLADLDYDLDDYRRFLEMVAEMSAAAHPDLPSRIALDHLADFVETMSLNDAGSWGTSFRARQAEVAGLVATLGSFDRSVLAAEARIVLNRIEAFGEHDPFFSLFDGAGSRPLEEWGAVSDTQGAVDLLIDMMTWGQGSARLAASALWRAPIADLAVAPLRGLLPHLRSSTEHERIAALTLCSLVDGPEPDSWVQDDDPVLRAVAAAWLQPVGPDGMVTPEFRQLLRDPDRNVRARAVRRLASVDSPERSELLDEVAQAVEPGWICLSCRTVNPAALTSCGMPDCHRVPSHPAQDARQILDGTFKDDD